MHFEILTLDGTEPAAAARAALDGAGCVILRHPLSPGWLARVARTHGSSSVQPPSISGALAEPEYLASSQLAPILESILGEGYIMGRVAIGAAANEVLTLLPNRSGLFGDARHDARIPAIGVAVYVALTPCSLRIVPGSHRARDASTSATVALAAGDCLVCDTRLVLGAEAPHGTALVTVYYRHWFREPTAPIDAPPVRISMVTYRRLPPALRALFAWRFDRYLKHRPRLLIDRGVRKLPAPIGDVIQKLLPRKRS